MRQSILMVISKSFDGTLQSHTGSLSHLQDFFLVSMSQHISLLLGITVKYVSIHSVVSSFRVFNVFGFLFILGVIIIGNAGIFQSLADQSIDNSLLLFGEGIKDILYGLFLLRLFLLLFVRFCHSGFILLFNTFAVFIGIITSMCKHSFLLRIFIFTMG